MDYLEKIYGSDFLLSSEVPSNSQFRVVRELEANLLQELLPVFIFSNSHSGKQSLRKFIYTFNKVKNSKNWQLLYDFGKLLGEGKLSNAETMSLSQFKALRDSELNKAFNLKDASIFLSNVLSDFSQKFLAGISKVTDKVARDIRSAIRAVSQSLFIGGLVDSLSHGDDPDNVYVIRVPYPGACKYCIRVFLNGDGSPKIFTLSELLANGEDLYRKPADYVPVLNQLHFNCRCGIIRVSSTLTKEQLFDVLITAQTDYTEALKLQEEYFDEV